MQLGIPLKWMKLHPQEAECCQQILRNSGGGWIAKHVNKRLSMPASIYLARWGVTPNQITFFNLLLGVLAGVFASMGGYYPLLAAGVLFQLVSIIDGCDGEVAKLNQKATRFGSWFDTVGDNLSFVIFIVGVTFGLYRHTHAEWIITAAQISLISFALLLSVMISYLLQNKDGKASLVTYEKEVLNESIEGKQSGGAFLVKYGKYLIKKDFFAFLFFFLTLINFSQAIVFFAAVGSFSVAVVLLGLTYKRWRVRREAERSLVVR